MDSIAEHKETYFYVVAFQITFTLLAKCELVTMHHQNLHVILALRDVCVLKSNDLTGHTQSRGVPFAASVSNYIGYNIRRIRFHLVVLAPKTVSSVPLCSASD